MTLAAWQVAAPIATVPVYYSTPVYYYDTSVSIFLLCVVAFCTSPSLLRFGIAGLLLSIGGGQARSHSGRLGKAVSSAAVAGLEECERSRAVALLPTGCGAVLSQRIIQRMRAGSMGRGSCGGTMCSFLGRPRHNV